MKIDRAGRYGQRDGGVAKVLFITTDASLYPVVGITSHGHKGAWTDEGYLFKTEAEIDTDLIAYLGPLEPGDDGFAKEIEA